MDHQWPDRRAGRPRLPAEPNASRSGPRSPISWPGRRSRCEERDAGVAYESAGRAPQVPMPTPSRHWESRSGVGSVVIEGGYAVGQAHGLVLRGADRRSSAYHDAPSKKHTPPLDVTPPPPTGPTRLTSGATRCTRPELPPQPPSAHQSPNVQSMITTPKHDGSYGSPRTGRSRGGGSA